MNTLNNLLAVEGYPRYVNLGEAALYALIGFLVVFAGIGFLILIVWLVGKIMKKANGTVKPKTVKKEPELVPASVKTDEIDEETLVIITAAIAAYYQKNNPKCEFKVKRIKKVRRNDYA